MKVQANRQIHSSIYGSRVADEEFEVDRNLGEQLMKTKLVRPSEKKVIAPTAPSPAIRTQTAGPSARK